LAPDKLGGDLGIPLGASLAPAVLDRHGALLDPAELAQPLHKCVHPCALGYQCTAAEVADGRQLRRLLRAPRERPGCCRAANQGDELAPLHSSTSSARASNVGGTSSHGLGAGARSFASTANPMA